MATTIVTKYGSDAPATTDIVRGELAVDTENGRLYTENAAGAVVEIGLKPESNVDVTGTITATGTSVFASLDISGDIDVDGTTNLDVVDIDGAVDMASTLGVTGVATLASLVATTADINAGTIDGTVIGGATAAAISGTTGQFATSLNVDGTATVDGLTSSGNVTLSGASSPTIRITDTTNTCIFDLRANDSDTLIRTTSNHPMILNTNQKDRIQIAANGDISFYEDTGTTAKLFWDASAESLGIGTASPSKTLDIRTNSSGEAAVLKISNEYTGGTAVASMEFGQTSGTAKASIAAAVYNDGFMAFRTNDNTEKMRIDAAGHVGIGTDSPTTGTSTYYDDLVIKNATSGTGAGITIQSNTSNGYGGLDFRKADGTQVSKIFASSADGAMGFETAGAERIRIDSSGNVGIGLTPFGWSSYKNVGVSGSGSLYGTGAGSTLSGHSHGCYYDGANWKYSYTGAGATRYEAVGATSPYQAWYTANSGTADANITFSEAMRIDSSANLLVGRTSDSGLGKLQVYGAADFAGGNVLLCRDTGNVGIGTSSPQTSLAIETSGTQDVISPVVTGQTSGVTYGGLYTVRDGAGDQRGLALKVFTANVGLNEVVRISSAGNVKIGDASTDITSKLVVSGNASADVATFMYDNSAGTYFDIDCGAAGGAVKLRADARSGAYPPMLFQTGGAERMRIDGASGNLLVGKTAASSATVGFQAGQDGFVAVTRASAQPLVLNRTTSDGTILDLRKDGTTVGSIGVLGDRIYLAGVNEAVGIDDSWNAFVPLSTGGGNSDNDTDLGNPSSRWKDLYLSSGAYASFIAGQNDTNTSINFPGSDVITFNNGGSEAARIDASGNLLVGTTDSSPYTTIEGYVVALNNGSKTAACFGADNVASRTIVNIVNPNGSVGSITTDASATAFNTSSDQRLKENIADADDAGSKVDAIQVRKFDWKADGSHQDYGMIAQELIEVAPEAVSAPEDPDEMMGVDYSKLVPMLVKEIQQLRQRVAQLEE